MLAVDWQVVRKVGSKSAECSPAVLPAAFLLLTRHSTTGTRTFTVALSLDVRDIPYDKSLGTKVLNL